MTPIQFPEAQHFMGRPSGMSDEECGALPVCRGVYAERFPAVISCFEPTDEERKAIAEGANIYLHVIGRTMPPVMMATEIVVDTLAGRN